MSFEFTIAVIFGSLAVALLAGAMAYAVLFRRSVTRRRLGSLAPLAGSWDVVSPGPLTTGRDPVLARWSMLLPKSAKDMSVLERRLASGGFRSAWAPVVFRAAALMVPVICGLVPLALFGLANRKGWIVAAAAGMVGFLTPGVYLDYRASQRRKQIRNGLPDVIDLLIVCLEAGSSLDQSVVKVSEELAIPYPALAEELRVLTTETRAGIPRLEAFKNLAKRTKVDDIRELVAMLIQTDRFGTSVAQALRTMADEMRTKRRQAAEEMAAKVGVKLVFPLVFFMFPALYVVILGPAVIKFIEVFSRDLK